MGREIKFRAWNKKDSQMINWFTLIQSAWNTFRGNTPLSLIYEILVARKDDFNVMQYTGLKDKKGKEIYEGDIINVYDWGIAIKKHLITAEIIWDDEDHCWNWKSIFGISMCESEIDLYDRWRNIEVIGNIYENPDLLTPQ